MVSSDESLSNKAFSRSLGSVRELSDASPTLAAATLEDRRKGRPRDAVRLRRHQKQGDSTNHSRQQRRAGILFPDHRDQQSSAGCACLCVRGRPQRWRARHRQCQSRTLETFEFGEIEKWAKHKKRQSRKA